MVEMTFIVSSTQVIFCYFCFTRFHHNKIFLTKNTNINYQRNIIFESFISLEMTVRIKNNEFNINYTVEVKKKHCMLTLTIVVYLSLL